MQAGKRPAPEARDFRYDTALIKDEAERLLAAYLGQPGKVSGSRLVWHCPKCGKPKLSLFRVKGAVGCLNAGCEVETNTDVIGVIASLEGLQTRGQGFKDVCALSYRLLSIPDPRAPEGMSGRTPAAGGNGRATSPNGGPGRGGAHTPPDGTLEKPARAPHPEVETYTPAPPEVVDAVLSRVLQLCPLEERDVLFLASRGVAEATARHGRFGSITARRARHAVGILDREFPREQLLGTPGVREHASGRGDGGKLGFTLWGNFLLIPYFDRAGRLVALEGRAVGDAPEWAGKYTSLRNAGNHLYVFPGFDVDDLVAICEGPMGAIVAAQEGLPVGAIQGVKRYTSAGEDAPLPELAGADFGGRTVLYVPDLDVKPDARADVEEHAARACEFLIARQNGRALIATVPQDGATGDGAKDLDSWILSAPEAGPYGVLSRLRSRAHPPEEWPGLPDPDGTDDGNVSSSPPGAGRPAPEERAAADAPPAPTTETAAERSGAADPETDAPAPEASEDETGEDGTGGREQAAGPGPQTLDAYDRWYAVLEGYPGSAELAVRPEPYRPRSAASPVPDSVFAQEAELYWAGLFALAAALVFWYYVGASEGWLAGDLGFLPSLPGPLPVLGGIPFALLFGAAAGAILLLHLRARRLAARRHLLGGGQRR